MNMNNAIQVDKSHYGFGTYITKKRWCSIWHQLDEIQKLNVNKVLEIGGGKGILKSVAKIFDINIESLDVDPELKPDYVGSATSLPFADNSYDAVCAFQMLEHLPYEQSLLAFSEMVRVSNKYILLSLPDAKILWRYVMHIPKHDECNFFLPKPRLSLKAPIHSFDGEHYWEINKAGYSLKQILADLTKYAELVNTYRVNEYSYHRFFIFKRYS